MFTLWEYLLLPFIRNDLKLTISMIHLLQLSMVHIQGWVLSDQICETIALWKCSGLEIIRFYHQLLTHFRVCYQEYIAWIVLRFLNKIINSRQKFDIYWVHRVLLFIKIWVMLVWSSYKGCSYKDGIVVYLIISAVGL